MVENQIVQPHENIVEIEHAVIDYPLRRYTIRAVTDVSLSLKRGAITALVGESGSGKTTLASSLLRCISEPGILSGGEVRFYPAEGAPVEVHKLSPREIDRFRWEKVSMVFQAAQSALNPVYTVRAQFEETVREHGMKWSRERIEQKMREVFDYVKLDYDRVARCYPHELSGGMKQRVMIAFSLLLDPELIILDEPTTALDVITQDYIFSILKRINREKGISMLLMTHDIGIVAKFADYVGVLYAGRLVEFGSVFDVFRERRHPYTKGLIRATPSLIGDLEALKPIGGSPPDLRNLPQGCVFSPRCPYCTDACREREPDTAVQGGRCIKCIHGFEEYE